MSETRSSVNLSDSRAEASTSIPPAAPVQPYRDIATTIAPTIMNENDRGGVHGTSSQDTRDRTAVAMPLPGYRIRG